MKGESNSSTVGMETYSATFQSSTNSDIENIADVAIEVCCYLISDTQ